MKKIAVTMLIVSALLTTTALGADFKDMKGHWAEDAVNTLADRGVIDGFTNELFAPDEEVTRAQYLKMIMETTGMDVTPFREGECLELKGNEWYAPYLQKALDCGLVPGAMITGFKQNVVYTVDENGKATESKVVYSGAFNGNLPISREEMAVLTQYVYQYTRTILTNEQIDTSKARDFDDSADIGDWAKASVKLAVANGFIEGMENNCFNPKSAATRAQAATIILRVSNKQEKK